MMSTVDSPRSWRARDQRFEFEQENVVFEVRAPGLSSKRAASISMNSSRVSAGLWRCTACTRAG